MRVDVEHVSALDMVRPLMLIPNGSLRVIRVVAEDCLIENDLTVALRLAHMVEQHTVPHRRKRITRELESRQWYEQWFSWVVCRLKIRKRKLARGRRLNSAVWEPGYERTHEFSCIRNRIEPLPHDGAPCRTLDHAFAHRLIHERLACPGHRIESLDYKVLEIEHLNALALQQMGEHLVLLLGAFKKERPVAPYAIEVFNTKVHELPT